MIDPPPISGADQSSASTTLTGSAGSVLTGVESVVADVSEVDVASCVDSLSTTSPDSGSETLPSSAGVAQPTENTATTAHTVNSPRRMRRTYSLGEVVCSAQMSSLRRVKTRTLLLLSLGCAVAIIGAGLGLWLQLSNDNPATPVVPIGEVAQVGDLSVAVVSASRGAEGISVELELGGVEDDDATDGFTLIAAGELLSATGGNCDPVVPAVRLCTIAFADVDADSHVLAVRRGEQVRRWVLPLD